MHLFGQPAYFFIVPELQQFDGIIGTDFLLRIRAVIDLDLKQLRAKGGAEDLLFHRSVDVNFSTVDGEQGSTQDKLNKIIKEHEEVFADPNDHLPFNTSVVGSIRTVDDSPIYSKLYPYPAGVSDFVNKEIREMLEGGIIRPSRSPYNNPIWVVDKKGVDELGNKKKRMVIDFRKLNDRTIDDRYPVPDITNILSNLGKANYFSKVDLKSGFFQILLREGDREKTAFSVNNGKYEYCRLPFGLKNAPSIFQRAIDDILRENIGTFVQVYMDDVIIYSETAADHLVHLEWVLRVLKDANMRVSKEKSEFFKNSIEFLGFIVSRDGIQTCPDKIAAISNFPEPNTLFHIRSFLGLAGYYRRFIKSFATIAKPLTDILKGEYGTISAGKSKGVKICLDAEQRKAFHNLRRVLASEDVILPYPDFNKSFELTTDASSSGLGAVLSQGGKPVTMISRTLQDREINFATNERELLAIVWALKKLRNFLYGTKNLIIYTDHQPLTFAVSDKNTNAKLKRWKAFIDEHNAKIVYKPGKDNYVADALSRQAINALDNESTSATVHSEVSLSNVIRRTETPLNCYKNQIVIEESDEESTKTFILFKNKKRIVVRFSSIDSVYDLVKDSINRAVVNAIHCELEVLANIQHRLVEDFPSTKFWHAPKFVIDITNKDEQREIVCTEHNRAHRGAQNVVETVLRDYYFPGMGKIAAEVVANCSICRESKYVRHPVKQVLGKTPIPSQPGERIHVDIFSTDNKHFLTCIDKFTKFALVHEISSRNIVDITPAILQIINFYPSISHIYCDNEAALKSRYILDLLNRFGVEMSNTPPDHSTSNGQVERFHSTLAEIARCLKGERQISDTVELIYLATIEYNRTIHSVTKEKPIEALYSPELRDKIKKNLIKCQEFILNKYNSNKRCKNRVFNLGERVFVRTCRRRGNKLSIRFVQRRVQADLGSTVLIRGRVVHKDNIR